MDFQLPSELAINQEAGRGGFLIVNIRLESGESLAFIVDSGTSGTFIDKSLESKLGKLLGTTTYSSWGVKQEANTYAMPKLYLGGAPLLTEGRVTTLDFRKEADSLGRPVMGMLGYDTLRHYCIQLDFAAGEMRFLDDEKADKQTWGKSFPIVALNAQDGRPAVADNLLGLEGPHSLIDSGCTYDGWLRPQFYQQWTNNSIPPKPGEAREPAGFFNGEKYPLVSVAENDVESDGIGLRFLARHLVTLDFPKQTLYLQPQSIRPLADWRVISTPMQALDSLITDVLNQDGHAARQELVRIEKSRATELEKAVARKLTATLENKSTPVPAVMSPKVTELQLGDARPDLAEVGWLRPAANRLPLNGEIESPLLDSGKIYATGLYAHAPSRYVYELGGKWKTLRGEAGLLTAFQNRASGVVFVIKTDGKEVFRSPSVRGSEHPRYELDVTGVKTLELIVEKSSDQNGGNWGLWLDPTLLR